MPPPSKRATLRDVANATGLSPSGVSYALRGLQSSPETQARVRAAADELGYEVDPIARALASGRSGMIGLLSGSLDDLWQQQLAAGVGRELLAHDRYALILDARGDPDRELTMAKQLRDQRVDGLIVSSLDPSSPAWSTVTKAIPVVSIGDALQGASAGEVLFDNRAGVTLALEHLQRLGHRRVAVLTPTVASTPDRPADVFVSSEAQRLGLQVSIVASPHALTDATKVAMEVMSRRPRPTAVFAFSDSIAYGAYAAAGELGLSIPGDISICGYDNHPFSSLLTPMLTSVDWDADGIVRDAVRLVLAAAEGSHRRKRIVKAPTLFPRASTARPARTAARA